jgi:hypothetical protein
MPILFVPAKYRMLVLISFDKCQKIKPANEFCLKFPELFQDRMQSFQAEPAEKKWVGSY